MSAQTAIRAGLVAAIQRVPDAGVVHDRERYASNAAEFLKLYGGDARKGGRGWFVAFRSRAAVRRVGRRVAVMGWEVVGFIAFDDAAASEHLACDLAFAVASEIETDPTLGGACSRLVGTGDEEPGVAIRRVEPVLLANAVHHRVRLELFTESIEI